LNRDYAHWIRTGRPFVTLKLAQSRDGRITPPPVSPPSAARGTRGNKDAETGGGVTPRRRTARWISGAASRRRAHQIRRSADAILVGVNTVLADDPRLSVRLKGYRGRQPVKVVLDAFLRTPPDARLFAHAPRERVWIFTSRTALRRASRALSRKARILAVPVRRAGRLDWRAVLRELGRRGIVHLMIEGGGEVAADALRRGIVQEMHLFVAPLRVGRSVPKTGLDRARLRRLFSQWKVEKTGRDLHYQGVL
jgi:diaminohydroxyphosphoribosylaminopyrimidine deaminase/5-amino-6-(5-phosphoribosylamino)uracil reductase